MRAGGVAATTFPQSSIHRVQSPSPFKLRSFHFSRQPLSCRAAPLLNMNERKSEKQPAEELRPWTLAEILLQERAAQQSGQIPDGKLPQLALKPPALDEVIAAIHEDTRSNPEKASAALCFSGGGIRSATFGLGVLQTLARSGLLQRIDYLSTVSGGGYLGSWLSAWICREKSAEPVFTQLAGGCKKSAESPEVPQLSHLRRFSNYLAPQLSVGSADTWALAGIFLRNLVLNWLVLLPVLFVLMILPRFFIAGIQTDGNKTAILIACAITTIALFVSTWYAAADLPSSGGRRGTDVSFAAWRLLPLFIGAHALALAWAWVGNAVPVPKDVEDLVKDPRAHWDIFNGDAHIYLPFGEPTIFPLPKFPFGIFTLIVIVPIVLGAAGGWIWMRRKTRANAAESDEKIEGLPGGWSGTVWRIFVLMLTTVAGAAGVDWFTRHIFPMPRWDVINYTAFSPPLILAIFLFTNFLIPGLSSWVSTESDREWWGRASGWMLAAITASATMGAVVFWGPIFLQSLEKRFDTDTILASLGGISGLFGGLSALLGASSKSDAKPTHRRLAPKLLSFGAFFFILLVGMFFSFLVDEWVERSYNLTFNSDGLPTLRKVALIALIAVLLTFVMGKFVNVNRFSMHMMYRNRLIRAYLGASRKTDKRKPHRFTGFDQRDDIRFHELGAQRPLHIVNITLNLVGGDNLAWQERRAESFTASPLHCGAWQLNLGSGTPGAYQSSRHYGHPRGLGLGTAFAISGAAANPNSGYHSSALVTLLMTHFNLRLGWWLPNPGLCGKEYWQRSGPNFALTPLIAEAFGMTNEKRAFVNLSDGGHFDNMGLYEMLLRRCHFIIVIDGEQDPLYGFAGLSEGLRKARIDLGIEVDLNLNHIAAEAPKCCAVGRIRYSAIDGVDAPDGWLLYIKPVILGNEPADVRHYRSRNGAFPHESTGDQFFSESQFESYRALGQHLAEQIGLGEKTESLGALFSRASEYATSLSEKYFARLRSEANAAVVK